MKLFLIQFYDDRSAVSSLEYALLAGLIAVIVVVSVGSSGAALKLLFESVKDQVVLALQ